MRIVSLLPAATEILYALGAGNCVVGVTHECDFPQEAKSKPALIRPRVDPDAAPGELDRQVRSLVERGESIYAVDAELLERLAPDLIVTQDLCHVCAAAPEDLAAALARFPRERNPRVITFAPRTLQGVWNGIRAIGTAIGRNAEGESLASRLEADVAETVRAVSDRKDRPRVLCLEWFDPLFVAGHWVPEMVRLAGGEDLFGREAEPSFVIGWEEILAAQPDVVLLMSCGYGASRNLDLWRRIAPPEGWRELTAERAGRIYALDANAYASRSGPRLADGVALMASLLHPGLKTRSWPEGAWLLANSAEQFAKRA